MENKLHQLLCEINEIRLLSKSHRLEKYKRSELFNIFSILGLSSSEVRLHSSFISELLNPQGSHGMGSKLLSVFIEHLEKSTNIPFHFDISNDVQVKVEYAIDGGFISNSGDEGGRIDILIEDINHHAIIIENKIYACDQDKQLLRYWNFCRKRYNDKFTILYLTLDGKLASDASVGRIENDKLAKEGVDYISISYDKFIRSWLERCIELTAERELVRTTIRQYINNLDSLLNMSDIEVNRLVEIALTKEHYDAALSIIEYQNQIGFEIRRQFIESLIEYAKSESMGLIPEIENMDNLLYLHGKNTQIKFYVPECSKQLYFAIGWETHSNYGGVSYGIYAIPQIAEKIKGFISENEKVWKDNGLFGEKPIGWAYFWSASGKEESGRWWRWDDISTLRDMMNGSYLQFIKENVLTPKAIDALRKLDEKIR